MKKAKKGFTLAEVLVTLTIIGVIAALTIPLLIGGTGNAETRTAFKKSVSVLNQAMLLNQGQSLGDASALATSPALALYFARELNVTDFPMTGSGATAAATNANQNAFHTTDGAYYVFTSSAACGNTASTTPNCYVTIDVNGAKGPTATSVADITANQAALTPGTTTATDIYKLQILGTRAIPLSNDANANAVLQD